MTITAKEPRSRKSVDTLADMAVKGIGSRLRGLRVAQKLTLIELAKLSGVDIATISRIETGKMSGTLESHIKLATALGYKITDLYAGIEEVRTKDAVTVQPPAGHGEVYVHRAGKSSMTMLTSDVLKKKLMPVLVTIEPGGSTNKEEARVGTERFLYVLEGTVEVQIAGGLHVLKRGGSIYFDASLPHQIRNTGRAIAKCLSVVTPPAL